MDGLTNNVPFGAPLGEDNQMNISDINKMAEVEKAEPVACRIYDWRANKSQTFESLKENI